MSAVSCFALPDRTLRLACGAPRHAPVFEALCALLAELRCDGPASAGTPCCTCTLIEDGSDRPAYRATDPRGRVVLAHTRLFVWALAAILPDHLFLHGACVGSADGRATLLTGPPGAGKTTAALALAQAGHRLYADDLTLLRRADLRPVPLRLRSGLKATSPFLMPAREGEYFEGDVLDDALRVDPRALRAAWADPGDTARLDRIVLVCHAPCEPPALTPVPRGEAIERVVAQIISPGSLDGSTSPASACVRTAMRLLRAAPAYHLRTSGRAGTVELLAPQVSPC